LGCTYFIDDLPEFLSLPGYYENILKILFDPKNKCFQPEPDQYRMSFWQEILSKIKADVIKSEKNKLD